MGLPVSQGPRSRLSLRTLSRPAPQPPLRPPTRESLTPRPAPSRAPGLSHKRTTGRSSGVLGGRHATLPPTSSAVLTGGEGRTPRLPGGYGTTSPGRGNGGALTPGPEWTCRLKSSFQPRHLCDLSRPVPGCVGLPDSVPVVVPTPDPGESRGVGREGPFLS